MVLKDIATSFTLGKNERLKSRKLIGQMFREGKSISSYPFKAIYFFPSGELLLQAGFTVSSKNFKKAVERNRIKRLMREAYRLQKHEMEELLKSKKQKLSVFFIYTGKEAQDYQGIFKKMGTLIQMLIKNINDGDDKRVE